MGLLILRRLVATIPVLLLVTAGVFALIHLTPGDPIDAMMAESVDDSVKRAAPAATWASTGRSTSSTRRGWGACCRATSATRSATASR